MLAHREPYRLLPAPIFLRTAVAKTLKRAGFVDETWRRNVVLAVLTFAVGFAGFALANEHGAPWLALAFVLLWLVTPLIPDLLRGDRLRAASGARIRVAVVREQEGLALSASDTRTDVVVATDSLPGPWRHRARLWVYARPAFHGRVLALAARAHRGIAGEPLVPDPRDRRHRAAAGLRLLGAHAEALEARGLVVRQGGGTLVVSGFLGGFLVALPLAFLSSALSGPHWVTVGIPIVVASLSQMALSPGEHGSSLVVTGPSVRLKLEDAFEARTYCIRLSGPGGTGTTTVDPAAALDEDLAPRNPEALDAAVEAALRRAVG